MNVKNLLIIFMLLATVVVAGCVSQTTGQTTASKELQRKLFGPEPGDVAPDFTVQSVDGETIKLSEINREKPVVIMFTATWCPSCFETLTEMKKVYPEFKDRVVFINIDLDLEETADLIRDYKNRNGFQGEFAVGNREVLLDYAVAATTTKYAIDKDGIIIYKDTGAILPAESWKLIFEELTNS